MTSSTHLPVLVLPCSLWRYGGVVQTVDVRYFMRRLISAGCCFRNSF